MNQFFLCSHKTCSTLLSYEICFSKNLSHSYKFCVGWYLLFLTFYYTFNRLDSRFSNTPCICLHYKSQFSDLSICIWSMSAYIYIHKYSDYELSATSINKQYIFFYYICTSSLCVCSLYLCIFICSLYSVCIFFQNG